MKRLLKSKKVLVALPVIVLIFVSAISLPLFLRGAKYECTLEDIGNCEKQYSALVVDILQGDLQLTDKMSLALYFDHWLNDDEVCDLEKLGVIINWDSWIPPVGVHPYHVCGATCTVENICQLCDLNFVKRIASAEPHVELE